ncbi:unnamed protein product [Polarella glacialis]|uniref:HECT-type E3 ubiquitin transferase n=1 Tax=Polarella glacialis TaxID=89957 RepID=A0A813EX79_POLGL|nr:unnamed protein product [Polarella glacialis]
MPHHLGGGEAVRRWPTLAIGVKKDKRCTACTKELPDATFSQTQLRRPKQQRRCLECVASATTTTTTTITTTARSPATSDLGRPHVSRNGPSPTSRLIQKLGPYMLVGILHDLIVNFPAHGSRCRKQYVAHFVQVLELISSVDDAKVRQSLKSTLLTATSKRQGTLRGHSHEATLNAGHILALSGSAAGVREIGKCGAEEIFTFLSFALVINRNDVECFYEMTVLRRDWVDLHGVEPWREGLSAAHWAVVRGRAEILKLMPELGSRDHFVRNSTSLMQRALENSQSACATVLLDICGVQVFNLDLFLGARPLKVRTLLEHPWCMELLKENRVVTKIFASKTQNGRTLAHINCCESDCLQFLHETLRSDSFFESTLKLEIEGNTTYSERQRELQREVADMVSLRVRDVHGETPAHCLLALSQGSLVPLAGPLALDVLAKVDGLCYLWDDVCKDPAQLSSAGSNELKHSLFLSSPSYLDLRSKQAWLSWYLRGSDHGLDDGFNFQVDWEFPLAGACEALGIDPASGASTVPRDALLRHVANAGAEGAAGDGLRREWLSRAVSELLNPQHGLFIHAADGHTLLPNPDAATVLPDHVAQMALLGRIFGLLLYHRETAPAVASLSLAFLKLAFGRGLKKSDLASVDPEAQKRVVQYLKDYVEDEVSLESFGLTFSYTEEPAAEYTSEANTPRVEWELVPGGAEKAVTEANKAEYIELYVQHRLGQWREKSSLQLSALVSGLAILVTAEVTEIMAQCCTPAELILLLGGIHEIDKSVVQDWREHTKYSGGIAAKSFLAQWFWSAVDGFCHEDRARLLAFVTGSTRPPASGFAHLSGFHGPGLFTLQGVDCDASRLPTAQTCFNTLRLPLSYPSREVMQTQLLRAIRGYSGFAEGAVAA